MQARRQSDPSLGPRRDACPQRKDQHRRGGQAAAVASGSSVASGARADKLHAPTARMRRASPVLRRKSGLARPRGARRAFPFSPYQICVSRAVLPSTTTLHGQLNPVALGGGALLLVSTEATATWLVVRLCLCPGLASSATPGRQLGKHVQLVGASYTEGKQTNRNRARWRPAHQDSLPQAATATRSPCLGASVPGASPVGPITWTSPSKACLLRCQMNGTSRASHRH
ncbi:hypothetical protein F5X68DRAFT_61391 [Plectosphaerella plurivora]|uniref:Uncharacterized protein n=1 Tax=Plectosphaerella plurivora TaxID=936078 RepID=A0A9P8V0W2_9PEZI|nr:hypothetical protein F5X68DRAFT_61391 [Plectosphaerella plurivora]